MKLDPGPGPNETAVKVVRRCDDAISFPVIGMTTLSQVIAQSLEVREILVETSRQTNRQQPSQVV